MVFTRERKEFKEGKPNVALLKLDQAYGIIKKELERLNINS